MKSCESSSVSGPGGVHVCDHTVFVNTASEGGVRRLLGFCTGEACTGGVHVGTWLCWLEDGLTRTFCKGVAAKATSIK